MCVTRAAFVASLALPLSALALTMTPYVAVQTTCPYCYYPSRLPSSYAMALCRRPASRSRSARPPIPSFPTWGAAPGP
jgi:hypothetical protein